MAARQLWLLCLTVLSTNAATTTLSAADFSFTQTISTISATGAVDPYTGTQYTYPSVTGQITVSSSSTSIGEQQNGTSTHSASLQGNATATSSGEQITVSTSSYSLTVIGGTTMTMSSSNATGTSTTRTSSSTSSSAQATNTVPCNGYPEFCTRKYSNISQVCSHNSAFVKANNAASNQNLPIMTQLNDGIRMLQGETHWVNNTVYNCHTTCSLLNAGTWEEELVTVRQWLEANPYDVVTFLISNSDNIPVTDYVAAITNSGLLQYVYEPAYIPQYRDQWPTLGEMILRGKRMVFFMDFNANQTAVPYILDQYSHIWQTPFSPTDPAFPCTIASPPNLNETVAREQYMYLINHNLNVEVDLTALLGSSFNGQSSILIPDTANLNLTNGAANQFGRLGAMVPNCTVDWGRPPNWLVVDYYEIGSPTYGSVFEVAATANNVTYNGRCCGTTSKSDAVSRSSSMASLCVALLFAVYVSL